MNENLTDTGGKHEPVTGPEFSGPAPDTAPKSAAPKRGRPSTRPSVARPEETALPGAAPKPKSRTASAPVDVPQMAKQLQGLHLMLGMVLGMPFIALSDKEAVSLADALANIAREFEVEFNSKAAAVLQLAATMGVIYLPRFIAFDQFKREKRKAMAQAPESSRPSNVVDLPVGQ